MGFNGCLHDKAIARYLASLKLDPPTPFKRGRRFQIPQPPSKGGEDFRSPNPLQKGAKISVTALSTLRESPHDSDSCQPASIRNLLSRTQRRREK